MHTAQLNGELPFNPAPATYMHVDLNSCFARVEQQANPFLRGKPIAVGPYKTASGIILAASVEAKQFGVITGMGVKQARQLCPQLIVLGTDPAKYRDVHQKIRTILDAYTDEVTAKSIDEYVLHLAGYPAFDRGIRVIAREIKQRIRQEVGDWLTVSVGLGPNRFTAKVASGLHKPDGLDEISKATYDDVYKNLTLPDLHGIATRNTYRLNMAGIYSVVDFYSAPLLQLRAAFRSINAYYWYLRLRGWEIDTVDFARKSFGNQYALPKPLATEAELTPILAKLTAKTCRRLRRKGYQAQGVHLAVHYRDHGYWHQGRKTMQPMFDTREVYGALMDLWRRNPHGPKPVRLLAVSVFNLRAREPLQPDLFGRVLHQTRVMEAVDRVNQVYGDWTVYPGRMLGTTDAVPDAIGFGNVAD